MLLLREECPMTQLIAIGVLFAALAVVTAIYETRRTRGGTTAAPEGAHVQRLATLGTLSAEAAHEMRGPLSALLCIAEELEGSGVDPELITHLREATSGMCRLTDDMGRLARRGSQEGVSELDEVVEGAIRMAAVRLRGFTVVKWVNGLPPVAMSYEQLSQVVLNLLINSADAMRGQVNGRLRITGRMVGEDVLLCVEDNGPGVDAAIVPTIFEPFETTKGSGSGTGLGLAISKRLIEGAGGTISLSHGVLGGACFAVRLPVAAAAAERKAA